MSARSVIGRGGDLLELALIAGIAAALIYFLRKFQTGLEQASNVTAAAGESAANAVEYFFPLTNPGQFITYLPVFPDGVKHAVNGEDVDTNGYFIYNGARFRLMTNTSGQKIAVAA